MKKSADEEIDHLYWCERRLDELGGHTSYLSFIWYLGSFFVSVIVAIPIITVFSSFFQTTTNYFFIIEDTFLYEYIFNSIFLLIGVLIFTFIIGVGCAYIVSFYIGLFANVLFQDELV